MTRIELANLIRIFDFYLALMFLIGLVRRWTVYRDTFLLVVSRGRWPKLLERMHEHKGLLLNISTMRPAALALGLMLTQIVASRMIWPQATLRVRDIFEPWWQLVPFFASLIPMVAVDMYFLIRVGSIDRNETEKYLDKAEKWAGTWKAKMVRLATLGQYDPNHLVNEGVKQGLEKLGRTMNTSMWWVSAQVALRMLFGLTVWILWAFRDHM